MSASCSFRNLRRSHRDCPELCRDERTRQGARTPSGPDHIREILDEAHCGYGKVVFDSDPKKLIEKVIALIDKDKFVSTEEGVPVEVGEYKEKNG